jgi:hypothetical protein
MSYDLTPKEARQEIRRWLPTVTYAIVSLLSVGLLATFICWKAHVWFWEQNVKIQNSTYQNSYATQQSDIDTMESAIQSISGAVDPAQATGDAQEACKYGARVTQLPAGDLAWYQQNCAGPAVSPSSSYYHAG